MRKLTNEAVRAAIDDCLSGASALPSVRAQVLNQVRGEVKVKKKFSVGIVFAMLLTLLMAGAAVAAGLGIFGQLGEREDADARLPGLESVSEKVEMSFTTEEGVTVTIDQAYYDGTRVFISYTKTGPFDVMTLGEGKPDDLGECDWELPGEVYGEYFGSESPNHQVMVKHLDGRAPRWAKTTYVNVHDGLQAGETYLDIIGGSTYLTEDGALVGWKECIVPGEIATDELVVALGTFTSETTYYQDETGLYVYVGDRAPAVWHEFTVKKDTTAGAKLVGAASGEGWTAEATLTASAIDAKGEIVVKCPQSWVEVERTWENPGHIDRICEWVLCEDGVVSEDWILEGTDPNVDGQLTYMICFRLDDVAQEMKLVPVYGESGMHMDEAILLTIAE